VDTNKWITSLFLADVSSLNAASDKFIAPMIESVDFIACTEISKLFMSNAHQIYFYSYFFQHPDKSGIRFFKLPRASGNFTK